jgi:hypothetical protein
MPARPKTKYHSFFEGSVPCSLGKNKGTIYINRYRMDLYALLLLLLLLSHTTQRRGLKRKKGAFVSFYSVKLQFPGSFKEATACSCKLWDCPETIGEGHVKAIRSFLHALSQYRGSVVRTLIATKSQRQNKR